MLLLPSTLTWIFLTHPYWPHSPLMKFINTPPCFLLFVVPVHLIKYSIRPSTWLASALRLVHWDGLWCATIKRKKKLKVLTHSIVFFVILLTDSGSLIKRLSLLHLITLLWLPSLLATSIQLLPPTPMKTASVILFIYGNESWRQTSSSKQGVRYKWDVSPHSCNGFYYYISA